MNPAAPTESLVDLSPLWQLGLLALALATLPLAWIAWRHRHASPAARWQALAALTVFLCFDLVVFGSFTRLTDSGLGCPDWPGCYGSASPLGAREEIHAAQTAMPTGPVTHGKAWIEMIHRYLATTVGALILLMAGRAWLQRWRGEAGFHPGWATLTLVWVCLQGAFGALTVTLKLYPAIVTLHLLGGMGLLLLLAVQSQSTRPADLSLPRRVRWMAAGVLGLLFVQIALGGWVSTNYAVLACRDFPTCQGQWLPPADFAEGFTLMRELGESADGGYLPFAALTAIHLVHRLGALVLLIASGALIWVLWRLGEAAPRRWARGLAAVAAWQLVSGLSNVVLGWPMAAALAHVGGAAAWVVLLGGLLVRSRRAQPVAAVSSHRLPRSGHRLDRAPT